MVRVDLVRDKVRRLRDTAALLRACVPESPVGLSGNPDALHLVSFRVYLGMQEAIDLASHLIADEGWGPAPSLRDHFTILASKGVLTDLVAKGLGAGVKVRNLIAHGYAVVDPVKLHAAAIELTSLLEAYCAAMLAFAESAAPASGR
jgi:uncharacterized protein YutE (UPF0331/DUF86 family)